MDETDKLKEIRSALNARLFLLILGVLLILNGVTSTGRQGLAYRNLAAAIDERIVSKEALPDEKEPGSDDDRKDNAAAEGTAAAAEQSVEEQLDSFILQMDEVGMTTGDLRRISVFFLIAAFFEIGVGLICAIFSNRVDRAKITLSAVSCLMVVEIAQVLFLPLISTVTVAVGVTFFPVMTTNSGRTLSSLMMYCQHSPSQSSSCTVPVTSTV